MVNFNELVMDKLFPSQTKVQKYLLKEFFSAYPLIFYVSHKRTHKLNVQGYLNISAPG